MDELMDGEDENYGGNIVAFILSISRLLVTVNCRQRIVYSPTVTLGSGVRVRNKYSQLRA